MTEKDAKTQSGSWVCVCGDPESVLCRSLTWEWRPLCSLGGPFGQPGVANEKTAAGSAAETSQRRTELGGREVKNR